MPDRADVAIIGAGLAGCAAAIELERRGVRYALFEKGRPFKDKACGDAFIPSAITILIELGLRDTDFIHIGGTPFHTIELFDNSKRIWRHLLKGEVGWMLPRRGLDQMLRDLVEKTTAIRYESKVLAISHGSNAVWNIVYEKNGALQEMNARTIILATGADNKLSATLHISGSPLPCTSVSAYMSGRHFDSLMFQFNNFCKNGYGWIFPVNEETANIGICVFDAHLHALKRSAEDFLKGWRFDCSDVHWRGGKGPLWSGVAKCWHDRNGLVSCGDAAALVDPLNGEGITAALHSGRLAAKHVHAYLNSQLDDGHLTDYSKSIKDFFSRRYAPTIQRVVWKNLCKL